MRVPLTKQVDAAETFSEVSMDRITVKPNVMMGKPTIRGLRITVEQVLRALAAGVSREQLLDDYPILEAADIDAVLLFAAEQIAQSRPSQAA